VADSPNIASDVAAGVKVDHRPWPGTKPGLKITREVMALKIREGMHTPSVRALAGQILRDAGFPKTIHDRAEALRSYVKMHVGYAPDPQFSEMVVAAPISLCLDGVMCMPIGDCDDATVACQSLIGAAGMDARFFHIEYGAGVQTHMMGAVRDDAGKWLEVDATTDHPVGYETKCSRKALVDPFDDKTFDLGAGAGGGSFIGVGKAFVGACEAWDSGAMSGYAAAIFGGRRDTGAGASAQFTCGCSFVMRVSGSSPLNTPPALPTTFKVASATNEGTVNGATIWELEGTYEGPPITPSEWANYIYGVNYPWSVVTADVTPPLVPMVWNGSACVTVPSCPAGTYWNGNACIAQVVFHEPAPSTGNTGGTKATYTPPTSGSSKTPYIVAGVAAVALIGGLILWKA
jgi:hypothetical protein